MKIKKLFLCLLAMTLVLSSILTGCSGGETMFADMKEISQIKSKEFSVNCDISMKSEEGELPVKITMDGKSDGQSAAVNLSVSSGALTFTLDDFVRMTDGTVYINLSPLFFSSMMMEKPDGMKDWISVPVSAADSESDAMYIGFTSTIIDSFEMACKNQDISKDGDTWTLNIPGDKLAAFACTALDQIDANISGWYDLYVEILDKTGSDELLKQYYALSGEEAEEDLIKSLKEEKADALKSWAETSTSLREQLNTLDKSISSGEANASGKLEISLSGKEGSRTAAEAIAFNYENLSDGTAISISFDEKLTETDEISVEAPDPSNVMTAEEYSALMSDYYSSYDEDYTGLSEEEENSIRASLKENQLFMYDSYNKDLPPCVITFDPKIYTAEEQLGNYSADLSINNEDRDYCFGAVFYEQGNLKQDMKDYYLEEGAYTSVLSHDAGEIIWSVSQKPDELGIYNVTFGIQLTDDTYLSAILSIDKNNDTTVKSYIEGFFKEIHLSEFPSASSGQT